MLLRRAQEDRLGDGVNVEMPEGLQRRGLAVPGSVLMPATWLSPGCGSVPATSAGPRSLPGSEPALRWGCGTFEKLQFALVSKANIRTCPAGCWAEPLPLETLAGWGGCPEAREAQVPPALVKCSSEQQKGGHGKFRAIRLDRGEWVRGVTGMGLLVAGHPHERRQGSWVGEEGWGRLCSLGRPEPAPLPLLPSSWGMSLEACCTQHALSQGFLPGSLLQVIYPTACMPWRPCWLQRALAPSGAPHPLTWV